MDSAGDPRARRRRAACASVLPMPARGESVETASSAVVVTWLDWGSVADGPLCWAVKQRVQQSTDEAWAASVCAVGEGVSGEQQLCVAGEDELGWATCWGRASILQSAPHRHDAVSTISETSDTSTSNHPVFRCRTNRCTMDTKFIHEQ